MNAPLERDARGAAGLDEVDRAIVLATQDGLPLAVRPFDVVAERAGVSPAEVMRRMQRLVDARIVRRIAAVPNHYRLGVAANGMSVWDVEDAALPQAGQEVGALSFVSHCYRRPRVPPRWPYNLFAMVHAGTRDEVEAHVAEIASLLGARQRGHTILYSRRILKKTGLRLRADRPTAAASASID